MLIMILLKQIISISVAIKVLKSVNSLQIIPIKLQVASNFLNYFILAK